MIKVGIIGFGKMGQIRHQEIMQVNNVEVTCIYEPEEVDNLPSNIIQMDSAESITDSESIDVVFICTPNYLNMPLTIRSLKNGKHVFCEKPPAFSGSDVKKIMDVEKKSGKVLMYGFNHRHHGSVKKMKEIVDSGELGEVLWMRGRYGKSVNADFYDDWRSDINKAGGGILMDQGIHMVDLFLYLSGDFNKVHAAVSNLYWDMNVEDNVFATLENTETGVVASLHSTMTQWRHLFSLEVFLKKGSMILNGLKTSSMTYGDEILHVSKNRSISPAAIWEDETHFSFHENDSWASEILEFFDAIKNNREVSVGGSNDALKLMRVIDEIYTYK
jgi:1,5-anhydro-D-fructose reductase (1,5-anhydro-D-mannitol-forming)